MDRNAQQTAAFLLLMGACWFAAWPYMGLWHDARLYALEALARLNPGAFERDLFLMYGSQGKFTLFPGIFAALIERFDLDNTAFALALAGKLLWIGALLFLSRQLLSWPLGLFGLLLVLAYPAFYDSHKVFSYGESFATPRIYAEAFTLLALAAWLRGHPFVAWPLVLLAGVFHPLMAIPGAGLLAWMTVADFGRARIAGLVLGLALVAAFAFAVYPDIGERILSAYDPAWHEAIALRNPYVFLDGWGGAAYGRMAWIGIVLAVAAREMSGRPRRLAWALLLITAGLLALSWLGTAVWKNIMLTQLQLWRALWLAQTVALMLLAALLPRLWKTGYADRILASCLVAAMLQDTWTMGLIALGGVALRAVFRRNSALIDPRALLWKALPYLIVLPWLLLHFLGMSYWVLVNDFYQDKPAWRTLLSDRVVMLAVGGAACWMLAHSGRRATSMLLGLAGAALLAAVLTWSSGSRNAGSAGRDGIHAQLKRDIPPGSVVAGTTQGGVQFIWFKLGRASYVSQDQTAGGLFNRETALEGARRLQLLEQAGLSTGGTEWGGQRAGPKNRKVSVQSIARLCGDAALDYVVVDGGWDGARRYDRNGRPFLSLFACRDFRVGRHVPL